MRTLLLIFCVLFFTFACLAYPAYPDDEIIQLKAILDLTTTVSEGELSLDEIVAIAKENQIEVIIPTDRDRMVWEYGLWPLRKVIKKRVEHESISTYGINNYLEVIKNAQRNYPQMIFIPGTESAPFYYWQGSYFDNNLTMHNWHKHIITVGLEKEADYQYMPVIGNPKGQYGGMNFYKLWPLILIFIGLFCFNKRKYDYKDRRGVNLGPISGAWQLLGAALLLIGFIFLFNNWPIYDYVFDQYKGDQGKAPYQRFIDYVKTKGGLSFWAHPDARYVLSKDKVGFETYGHSDLLLELDNYTGFSIFYEGYEKTGIAGGTWDKILKAYCSGERKRPIWAVGGLGFEKENLEGLIRDLQTIVLVKEKSKESVLKALEKGNIYVAKGEMSLDFKLTKFYIQDSEGTRGYVGDIVNIEGKPRIHIEGEFTEDEKTLQVKVINNGEITRIFELETPFVLDFEGDIYPGEKSYYRLEIKAKNLHFVTNPIFIY